MKPDQHEATGERAPDALPNTAEASPPHGLVERPEAAVDRLSAERDELSDRYLRVAAEFENFRKRTARERTQTQRLAKAEVVSGILDALDDLGRVAALDPDGSSAADVITGVELVERKLLHELEGAGLERVGKVGEPFDPGLHEAVAALPAERQEQDHQVAAVLQVGYRFGGALLRPARVQVHMWQDEADLAGGAEG